MTPLPAWALLWRQAPVVNPRAPWLQCVSSDMLVHRMMLQSAAGCLRLSSKSELEI